MTDVEGVEEERERLADIARIMTEAERRPLPDAAYYLYMKKNDLDRLETVKRDAPAGRQSWEQTVRQVVRQIAQERAEGYDETTFHRLRRAHLGTGEEQLRQALKAGIKLDVDCTRHFAYNSPNYFQDVDHAIEQAKSENPGFREETYEMARHHLAWAMR